MLLTMWLNCFLFISLKNKNKMFTPVQCVILSCDNCNEHFENYNGFSIFVDKNLAQEDAQEQEWHHDNEKHYCPKCHYINDNDELIINLLPPQTINP